MQHQAASWHSLTAQYAEESQLELQLFFLGPSNWSVVFAYKNQNDCRWHWHIKNTKMWSPCNLTLHFMISSQGKIALHFE